MDEKEKKRARPIHKEPILSVFVAISLVPLEPVSGWLPLDCLILNLRTGPW